MWIPPREIQICTMATKSFKEWIKSVKINTERFPSYPKTMLNDKFTRVHLSIYKNTAEGEFVHRLAIQKTGHMKSSVTMAKKPNTMIARVDANTTASWHNSSSRAMMTSARCIRVLWRGIGSWKIHLKSQRQRRARTYRFIFLIGSRPLIYLGHSYWSCKEPRFCYIHAYPNLNIIKRVLSLRCPFSLRCWKQPRHYHLEKGWYALSRKEM